MADLVIPFAATQQNVEMALVTKNNQFPNLATALTSDSLMQQYITLG